MSRISAVRMVMRRSLDSGDARSDCPTSVVALSWGSSTGPMSGDARGFVRDSLPRDVTNSRLNGWFCDMVKAVSGEHARKGFARHQCILADDGIILRG